MYSENNIIVMPMLSIIPAVRIVPSVPEATPSVRLSTDPMIVLVLGETNSPIPVPYIPRDMMIYQSGVSLPRKISIITAAQFKAIPAVATSLGSNLCEIYPDNRVKIVINTDDTTRTSPASSGFIDLIYCRYRLNRKLTANVEIYVISAARLENKKTRFRRKRVRSNTGLGTLSSHQTKKIIPSKPTVKRIIPLIVGRLEKPYMKRAMAMMYAIEPVTSNFSPSASRHSAFRPQKTSIISKMPSMPLRKRMLCHPRCSVITPPISGPRDSPRYVPDWLMPRALPLSSREKTGERIATLLFKVIPEPNPWKTRLIISIGTELANPPMNEAKEATTTPIIKSFLRPKISERRPNGTCTIAIAR